MNVLVDSRFALSPLQMAAWSSSAASASPQQTLAVLRLDGPIDGARLRLALTDVFARHEMLRVVFEQVPGIRVPVQVIRDSAAIAWSELHAEADADAIEPWIETQRAHTPDLAAGPLLSCALVRVSPARAFLALVMPSLCVDAWAMVNIAREIAARYAEEELPPPSEFLSYVRFAEWHRRLLTGEDDPSGRDYWADQLDTRQRVPLCVHRDTRACGGWQRVSRTMPSPLRVPLDRLAETATLEAVCCAGWRVALWRFAHHELRLSALHNGRLYEEMKGAVGLYGCWLPFRSRLSAGATFSEVIEESRQILQDCADALEYFPPQSADGSQRIEYGFSFLTLPAPVVAGDVTFTIDRVAARHDALPLKLAVTDAGGTLSLDFDFDGEAFRRIDVEALATAFLAIVQQAAADPQRRVAALALGQDEAALAVGAQTGPPHAVSAIEAFESQVRLTPDRVAVVWNGQHTTYAQLARRASQLAQHLVDVPVDGLVTLLLPRGLDAIVGMIAAWMRGAAYAVVDPAQPPARIAAMLAQCSPAPVLTTRALMPLASSERAIAIDGLDPTATVSRRRVSRFADPRRAAYVLFTSGTTGAPKGVVVEHGSLVNLWAGLAAGVYRDVADGARVAVNAPFHFDASVKQIVQLLSGATLVPVEEMTRLDPIEWLQFVRWHACDVIDATPAQVRRVLEESSGADTLSRTQRVLVGGEPLEAETWRALAAISPARAFNVYGPTECTVDATIMPIGDGPVSLGHPIANAHAAVCDPWGHGLPPGTPGELWLGGAGVARGYWRAPALTAERFVPDPWIGTGGRLYRTGDLVRRDDADVLQYVSRRDRQIKIRGFRVELGEIEAALRRHAAVRQPAVAWREQRLFAYAVVESDRVEAKELEEWLRAQLPDFMIPSHVAIVPSLPLTARGKIDYEALRSVDATAVAAPQAAATSVLTPIEEVIAGLWGDFLERDRIDRDDDFFKIGGHSILAVQVVSRIRQMLGVELRIRDLFERPTLGALAAHVDTLQRSGEPGRPPIARVPRASALRASFAQERLWFLQQLDPEYTAYNIPMHTTLAGQLRPAAFEQAFWMVVERHEPLRTVLPQHDGIVRQEIKSCRGRGLSVVDVSGLASADAERVARALAEADTRLPFRLAFDLPFRAVLVRQAPDRHACVATFHHVAIDEWSIGLLFRELDAAYRTALRGAAPTQDQLAVEYADFAEWQRQVSEAGLHDRQIDYWKETLRDVPPLPLPADRSRPPVPSGKGGKARCVVAPDRVRAFRALCQQEGATLFMGLLAAWNVLFHRYTGATDIAMATPVANRDRVELEPLVGFFLNTVVIRTPVRGDLSFRAMLGQVRRTALGAYNHADVPFERVVEALQPDRDLGPNPLFQVLFALGQRTIPSSLADVEMELLPIRQGTALFDLMLYATDTPDGLLCIAEYASDLFEAPRIERLLAHFDALIESLTAGADDAIGTVSLLTTAEQEQIVRDWNCTVRPMLPDQSVVDRFEQQVAVVPDAIAVTTGDSHISYARLDADANRCARYLRRRGVGRERFVAICAASTVERAAALLGVLKADAAYVGVHASYPRTRVQWMLEHTRAPVVFVDRSRADRVSGAGAEVIVLEDDWSRIQAEAPSRLRRETTPAQAAYITYTSGSTGQPKGIVMTHAALLNLLSHHAEEPLGGCARTLQFSPLSFDVSFQDTFTPWQHGGTLVLPGEEVQRDFAMLAAFIREMDVHRAYLPIAALQQVAYEAVRSSIRLPLRHVATGSEQVQITPAIVAAIRQTPGCRIVDEYGPSEAHVVTTNPLAGPPEQWPEYPAIGRPIRNVRTYALDGCGEPMPVGIAGELCLAGVCLARGYLHAPALTAERFVPEVWSEPPGGRMYRTGDLARYDASGVIECLGRIDYQMKIRGFRIEAGEVETALLAQPGVREAVVVMREDQPGDKRLVAYVSGTDSLDPSTLRTALRDVIPDYMIPAAVVRVDAWPLNPNGKVDRRALPVPPAVIADARPAAAAVSPVATVLARVWGGILSVDTVQMDDDFFDLGGHSLSATRVVSRINDLFSTRLTLRAFFASANVGELAKVLQSLDASVESRAAELLTSDLEGAA